MTCDWLIQRRKVGPRPTFTLPSLPSRCEHGDGPGGEPRYCGTEVPCSASAQLRCHEQGPCKMLLVCWPLNFFRLVDFRIFWLGPSLGRNSPCSPSSRSSRLVWCLGLGSLAPRCDDSGLPISLARAARVAGAEKKRKAKHARLYSVRSTFLAQRGTKLAPDA